MIIIPIQNKTQTAPTVNKPNINDFWQLPNVILETCAFCNEVNHKAVVATDGTHYACSKCIERMALENYKARLSPLHEVIVPAEFDQPEHTAIEKLPCFICKAESQWRYDTGDGKIRGICRSCNQFFHDGVKLNNIILRMWG